MSHGRNQEKTPDEKKQELIESIKQSADSLKKCAKKLGNDFKEHYSYQRGANLKTATEDLEGILNKACSNSDATSFNMRRENIAVDHLQQVKKDIDTVKDYLEAFQSPATLREKLVGGQLLAKDAKALGEKFVRDNKESIDKMIGQCIHAVQTLYDNISAVTRPQEEKLALKELPEVDFQLPEKAVKEEATVSVAPAKDMKAASKKKEEEIVHLINIKDSEKSSKTFSDSKTFPRIYNAIAARLSQQHDDKSQDKKEEKPRISDKDLAGLYYIAYKMFEMKEKWIAHKIAKGELPRDFNEETFLGKRNPTASEKDKISKIKAFNELIEEVNLKLMQYPRDADQTIHSLTGEAHSLLRSAHDNNNPTGFFAPWRGVQAGRSDYATQLMNECMNDLVKIDERTKVFQKDSLKKMEPDNNFKDDFKVKTDIACDQFIAENKCQFIKTSSSLYDAFKHKFSALSEKENLGEYKNDLQNMLKVADTFVKAKKDYLCTGGNFFSRASHKKPIFDHLEQQLIRRIGHISRNDAPKPPLEGFASDVKKIIDAKGLKEGNTTVPLGNEVAKRMIGKVSKFAQQLNSQQDLKASPSPSKR